LRKEPEAIIRILKRESEKLREEISQLRKAIDEKDALIKDLQEQIAALKEENQALRQELFGHKRTKGNKKGSAPGSAAHEPKKRGPPFGHPGSSRKKPEAERVDKTVVLRLEACPCCGGVLKEVGTVRERYEEEIVPIPLLVIRYLIKGGYCVRCGKVVYPEVPETIGNRHFGVHFLLYVAYLRYIMHLPENKIATLLNDTYDARISVGTVVAYLQQAAELFGDDYRRLKKELRDARICHYDDTGQRVNGENRWLWTFLTKEAVLYLTRRNRGKNVVIEVLGEDYDGVSTQDFYPSFDGAPGRKQKCWSHLLVAARKLVEQKKPPPRSCEFYKGLAQIYEDAKAMERTLTSAEDRERAFAELVGRLERFATQEGIWEHHRLKTLAKRALKYSRELFTFIICPGVEPTNNAAERVLRPRVRQRKIWGCFRTDQGAENADIMMSTLETMRKQQQDFFIHGKAYILRKLSQKGE
jgi:transposase